MKAFIVFQFLLFQIALINANWWSSEYTSSEPYRSSEEYYDNYDCPNARICSLPAEVGPCRGSIRRYFFNKHTGECEQFFYGGCRGNKNNFETIEECQQTCTNVCGLPSVVGPCKAAFERFFFNSKTGKCEKFIYGGCGGNGNNFLTEESCQQRCRPVNVCRLPKEAGPCEGSFPRYFYNIRTGRCERFIYGGCGGNGNNFKTKCECNRRCN